VSHDRALLASTCDKLIVVDGHGGATLFDGTYDEWEERRAAEAKAATKEAPKRQAPAAARSAEAPRAAKAQAAPRAKRSPLDGRSSEDLEAAIARMTARRTEIDDQLVSPAMARDRAKLDKLVQERAKLETDLAAHEEAWLRKAETG